MELEKILSTITEKLGKTSLSQRTMTDYINGNLPAEGVDPDDAYWEKHVNFLKSLNGNYDHDVAVRVEDFKKNWKPETNPAQAETPAVDDLLKRIEAMEKERDAEKANNLMNGLRSEVLGKSGELKVSNQNLWNDAVGLVANKEGITAETMLAEAKQIYEAKLKDYFGDGAVPYGGEQKGSGSQISTEEANAKRAAFKQKMVAQGRLPGEE